MLMAQRAARVEVLPPPTTDRPFAGTPEELGPDWLILRDCRLGATARGGLASVLLHPARGVAVLDILPSRTPDAAEAVRARLYAARFPAIFAGHLPVVHLQATSRQMPFLPSLLEDAFAAQPPLSLPGGDAWVGVAARALTAEHPVPRAEPQRSRSAAIGGRRRRRGAAAMRTAGAVLVCLAALGGLLSLVLGTATESELDPAPFAGVSPVEEASPRWPSLPEPRPAAEPVLASPSPAPSRTEAEATAPASEQPSLAPPPPLVEALPLPPQRAAPSPRRPDAVAPPARKAPERTPPRRQQEAGDIPSLGRAAPPPELAPDRCRRVSALVGSGAPLGDADMRFFNEAFVRW
jgi:hypothetical protein